MGPDSVEREVEEELEFHVEMRVREYVEGGMEEDEARRRAVEGFGDLERVKGRCRRLANQREGTMRRKAWWDEVRQDFSGGLRQLGRSRPLSLVAILTLALGIGANTAVFSVVNGVLLRPLPYDEPQELVSLWTRYLPSSGLDIPRFPLSPPELLDYREQAEAMEDVAAYATANRTLTGGQDPERVATGLVDRRLLDLLGVRPALGRFFSPEEHEPGAAEAVLLSHGLWRERFGADPAVVGATTTVNGRSARVVGVMPPDFVFPGEGVRMWMPLGLDEADPGGRGSHWVVGLGRLAEGSTLEQARAELGGITRAWNEEWEHHAMGHFIVLSPLMDDLVGDAGRTLLLLLVAVGLVLLVACGNVANLFLARAESRQREMAVRSALGAGRGRLARQLLTEAFTLAAVGGLLGLLLAWLAIPALLAIDPTAIPRSGGIGVNGAVLAFTVGLVVMATLLFGSLPALQVGGATAGRGWGGGRGADDDRQRGAFRRGLVVAQVALSLVVVIAAGLVTRSFEALRSTDAGVATERLITFELALPASAYPDGGAVRQAYGRLLEDLEAHPGVRSASAASVLPLTGGGGRGDFRPEGSAPTGDGVPTWNSFYVAVGHGYFGTMGIPLLRGRAIERTDDATSTPVGVVNQAFVDRYFPGEDVLGRRIAFSSGEDGPRWLTIVGVVGNVKDAMDVPVEPQTYMPHEQIEAIAFGVGRNMSIVVRTVGDPDGVVPALRAAVAELDPNLPMARLRTMEAVTGAALARPRLAATLLGGFGALALVLSAVGIFGVVSYSVTRRTREIGVRMALGAGRSSVARMMVREGTAPAALGALIGIGLSLLLVRFVEGLLFGVSPRDPLTFSVVPALLVTVAVLASWLPARRATRVDPTRALRSD